MKYASRRYHWYVASTESSKAKHMRLPLDDWESFLYAMADVADVRLEWFDLRKYRGYTVDMISEMVAPQKKYTTGTIDRIKKDVKCEQLKDVMIQFAKEAFKENCSIPRYNYFEKLITKEIESMNGKNQPAIFSWLQGHEREEAINDLKNNPPATAEEINDPKEKFSRSDYKAPVYDFFEKCRDAMAKKAGKNHQIYLNEEDKKDLEKEMEAMKLEAAMEKKKRKKGGLLVKKCVENCIPRKHH